MYLLEAALLCAHLGKVSDEGLNTKLASALLHVRHAALHLQQHSVCCPDELCNTEPRKSFSWVLPVAPLSGFAAHALGRHTRTGRR